MTNNNNIVIKVENLSKQYRLGLVGTGTLSHDLNRWWAALRGKEDPYLEIGGVNRRDEAGGKGENEYVWALRDINFQVAQGEVLGIIGKNGAGKSTLLKILSRVTGPTTGSLKVKGKMASLLEVGTGFHPELTGKENIYLNGAIMGMDKIEIARKLDEIIEFSGVERYIDTPVKRYSSGMYVRLAFAVAAHLDPEILIIDEVLAVGDVEFQKKCLGKMKDVAGQGRTVLFVSHNMSAVNTLCTRAILLESGMLTASGVTDEIVSRYLKNRDEVFGKVDLSDKSLNLERHGMRKYGDILSITTLSQANVITDTFKMGESLKVNIEINVKQVVSDPEVGICISTPNGSRLHHLPSKWDGNFGEIGRGIHTFQVTHPKISLYPGQYTITAWFRNHVKEATDDFIESALTFSVINSDEKDAQYIDFNDFSASGGVYVNAHWELVK